jgi:hypothetical protein
MWAHVIPTRSSSLWDYFDHDNAIFVDGKYRALQFKMAQAVVRLHDWHSISTWRRGETQ